MRITRRQLYKIIHESLNLQEQMQTALNLPGSYVSNVSPPMAPLEVDGAEIESIEVASDGSVSYVESGTNTSETADANMKTKLINLIDNNRSDFSFTPSATQGTSRQARTSSSVATSWNRYVQARSTGGVEKGEKIRDGWVELCKQDSSLGDGSYKSWVKWYNKTRQDAALMGSIGKKAGDYPSSDDVLGLYKGLVFITPELTPLKIDAGLTQEEADAINASLENEENNAKSEKEKKTFRQRRKEFNEKAKSFFPSIKIDVKPSKRTQQKQAQAASQAAFSLEGVNVESREYKPSEAKKMAEKIVKANPKKYAYAESSYNMGTGLAYEKLRKANDGAAVPYRVYRILTTDDQKGITIVAAKNMEESLSRGSLYRRRYYGRY